MFSKILIANRGEIALRVIRACHELGIRTVAVHSTADAEAMHVRMANESVCIGPAQPAKSYLSIPSIVAACEVTGANAIHPGYGFLSENASFAQILEDHGIKFIGPASGQIRRMGDKVEAKAEMRRLGIPCVPDSGGLLTDLESAHNAAADIGYPLLIKASAGGGGRGMKVVHSPEALEGAMVAARTEARLAFGNDDIYIEKFLERPRHIEFQIFGDGQGNAVHLGERDCSVQRRHQKVLEEAPSPDIDAATRARMGIECAKAAATMRYAGAGTLEFLFQDDAFYFMEMNTRLQVEHPVTEAIYGIDLVREQILVAAGSPLSFRQDDLIPDGHAVEARINAESLPSFIPCPGKVTTFHAPGGPGVRVDSALYSGCTIPPFYDSLIGKVTVHGTTREAALAKLRQALDELVVDGVDTNARLFHKIIEDPEFRAARHNIHWLEKRLEANASEFLGHQDG